MAYFEKAPTSISSWVAAELGHADLGDKRRTDRLLRIASALDRRPEASLPEAMGSWSETKATYRFLANDDIDPVAILEAHRRSTLERAKDQSVLLCVQDTTSLNFGSRRSTKGLGPIGDGTARGLMLHSCLAVSTTGTPLGFLWWRLYARPEERPPPRKKKFSKIPVAEKESQRWVDGVHEIAQAVPKQTRAVVVMDREGDLYEVFTTAQAAGVDVLVRSCYSRRVKDTPNYLWDEEATAPLAGVLDVEIHRQDGRPARTARLEVRHAHVLVRGPSGRTRLPDRLAPFAATIIFARETAPPPGQEPVHWRLLTTLPVESLADATRAIAWYSMRWRIERYHHTLKSGCRIESLQLEEAARIHRALAIYSVTAWRILYLTHEARANPTAPATTAFTKTETIILAKNRPTGPDSLTLREAIREVARIGGFLARRSDGEPGVQTLWKGLRALEERARGYEAAQDAESTPRRSG